MKITALYFAWLIACIGMLGSVYYSEVLHFEPCHLCWYQRIAVFSLAFILGAAFYRGYTKMWPLVSPLIILGFLIGIYQIVLQETEMSLVDMCGGGPNCSEKYDIGLGFISLPMLSATALFLMGILLLIANRSD